MKKRSLNCCSAYFVLLCGFPVILAASSHFSEGPCELGWLYYDGSCYLLDKRLRNLSDTEALCRKKDSAPMTFQTEAELDFIHEKAKAMKLAPFWIGVVKGLSTKLELSWDDGTFYDGPQNLAGKSFSNCSSFDGRNLKFRSCDLQYASVCKRSKFMTCPSSWKEFNGNCYLWEPSKLDRLDAAESCSESEGFLTTAITYDEKKFLRGMMGNTTEIWIGRHVQNKTKLKWRPYDENRIQFLTSVKKFLVPDSASVPPILVRSWQVLYQNNRWSLYI